MVLGSYGANTERGFSLAKATLGERNQEEGGCLEGFRRDEARLSILHISDEPEQSLFSWQDYLDWLDGEGFDDVVISAWVGPSPGGCGSAVAGVGYHEAVKATGGYEQSICDWDVTALVEGLVDVSVPIRERVRLLEEPVPETVQVRVDGLSTSWHWEDGDIWLDELEDGPHTVEVSYSRAQACP